MENIENGCHWYFPKLEKGIEEKNTTDSDEETLKNQSSIEALVRESIQNSLDVHDASGKPVIMEFRFGTIEKPSEKIPAFLEILKYINGSKDYILGKGYKDAHMVFDPMITYMENHKESFPYLCVADYNTIGMNAARFEAFKSKGSSFKGSKTGAGGSYGIGKAAYYMASQIRTIIVSSMYKENGENRSVFEGFAKLTTNMVDGVKHYDKGYYDVNEAEAIECSEEIPNEFARKSCGTSVYVMGVDDTADAKNKLFNDIVKTVVRNFWLAIHQSKLEVRVDFEGDEFHKIIIDSKELANIIQSYSPYDVKSDYVNPRPYYEAVTTAVKYNPDEIQSSVYFDIKHEKYGKARFYLIKIETKHDRYIKMRSPKMFVSMQKKSGRLGYNGVLVCEDRWNELLTYAEPPAHDAWERKRIFEKKTIDRNTQDEAANAFDEINRWVSECISEYFNEGQAEEIDFCGLKDMLYTNKDLGSSSRQEGNASSFEDGTPSNEEGNYGIMTTKSLGTDSDHVKVRPIASVTEAKKGKTESDEKGNKRGKKRKKRRKKRVVVQPINIAGTNKPLSENANGKKGSYREITNVDVHCFIPSGQDDKYLYTMVIKSPKKIEKAMVELSTGGAIASVEVPVSFSDKGNIAKNRIFDIPLEEGLNTLHFKFNDKITHSIKVATYEFK